MKNYFYIILVKVMYHPTGESGTDSQKVFCKGIIEIEAKEDKASLIYDKVLKKAMVGWGHVRNVRTELEFFNFWEEKEIPVDFEDLPVEDWDVSAGLWSALKKAEIKSYNDLGRNSSDYISVSLGKKNIIELKSFLRKKGLELLL